MTPKVYMAPDGSLEVWEVFEETDWPCPIWKVHTGLNCGSYLMKIGELPEIPENREYLSDL